MQPPRILETTTLAGTIPRITLFLDNRNHLGLQFVKMPLFQPKNINAPVLDQFSLQGKIVAVTGGAGGIGIEIVRGLAEAGADVALIYNSSNRAGEIAATIAKDTGVRVEPYQADVTSRASIATALQKIASEFGNGRLDAVIANSGTCANIPALEYTEESWRTNNAVNYDGAMWTAQAAGKIFKEQGYGNLVITASVSATLVNLPQTQAAYNASKAAAVHLAKCLAVEWADFARVNCISPGFILTDSKTRPHEYTEGHRLTRNSVLTNQPRELMEQWLAMIPGRRICHAAELKSVSHIDVVTYTR